MSKPKLVIFDLDGVLIDSKDLHYQALNLALYNINPEWMIPYKEHVERYNGNPTTVKLKLLSEKYLELTEPIRDKIDKDKQEITKSLLQKIKKDEELVDVFSDLIDNNYVIAVASNSVRETVNVILKNLGVFSYVSLILSNEDVQDPKPSPEIYIRCMQNFNTLPNKTVIFEDSEIGKQAAKQSGAKLVAISSRKSITKEFVRNTLGIK
jgi:HAD superfamily hydrolase (TIGR01509 family)